MKKVNSIVAMDLNGIIGKNGSIPWKNKSDMQFFKKTTLNNVVIMGRKTWESLPKRPLVDRCCIVLSRKPDEIIDRDLAFFTTNDPSLALDAANKTQYNEIFIIGGGEIYNLFKNEIDMHYVTIIDTIVEDGDTKYMVSPDDVKKYGEKSILDSETNTVLFKVPKF